MTNVIARLLAGMGALLALAGTCFAPAGGGAYPARSVRMVVPFAAAGPTDVIARLVAQKLSESLGQQFYVENIPGAGGNTGTAQVAKAAPDGYTMLVVEHRLHRQSAPLCQGCSLRHQEGLRPAHPGGRVSQCAYRQPGGRRPRTFKELIALIKARPGKIQLRPAGDRLDAASQRRIVQTRPWDST